MRTIFNQTANERQLKRFYAGVEQFAGTEVPPLFRLYGDLSLKRNRPLSSRKEYAGTLFSRYSPVFGPVEISGQYDQVLSYEDLAILAQFGVAPDPGSSSDGNPNPLYGRVFSPDPIRIGLNTFSAELGWPGFVESASMLHFPEITISGDIDDSEAAWKWSSKVQGRTKSPKPSTPVTATAGTISTITKTGATWTINQFAGCYVRALSGTAGNIGQIREVLSNTATVLSLRDPFPSAVANNDTFEVSAAFTSGIADRNRETIAMPGTKLFIDPMGNPIGTTQQLGRFISFSWTLSTAAMMKRFAEDISSYSKRLGVGEKLVSGQLKMEFDNREQYDNWNDQKELRIRIEQVGSQVNSSPDTFKKARIDVQRAIYDTLDQDERGENITATIAYIGFVDPTAGVPTSLFALNRISDLSAPV